MLKILVAHGIPSRIVSVIGLMYIGTRAKGLSPDVESKLLDILAGVLQGDTLAPYLFAIVFNHCNSVRPLNELSMVMTRSWDLLLNRGNLEN